MQSDVVQCSLCAKLSPNMEQTAARTAAQIGCTMQCRECGRTYETQAAEITRLTEALRAAEEEKKALRDALAWYGEQARLARLIHSEGDAGRHALQDDGGLIARLALAGAKP